MPPQYVPILMYHSISNTANPRFRRYAVPPQVFGEQLEYLKRHRYTAMTLRRLVQTMADTEPRLPPRPVVLTFDDAYSDFYSDAVPLLQRAGFTATLFVPTSF